MAFQNDPEFQDDFRKVGQDATADFERPGAPSEPADRASSENLEVAAADEDDDLEDDEDLEKEEDLDEDDLDEADEDEDDADEDDDLEDADEDEDDDDYDEDPDDEDDDEEEDGAVAARLKDAETRARAR